MAMTNNAMTYLNDVSEATCRSGICRLFRKGAVYRTLWEVHLCPWAEADDGPEKLAGGWSIHEITAVLSAKNSSGSRLVPTQQNSNNNDGNESDLDGTSGSLPAAEWLCSECLDPLANLFEAVGKDIGGKLASIIEECPFGGY